MNVVHVTVEKTSTGFSAYIPEVDGIVTAASSFNELRDNMYEAIGLFLETANEYGDEVPEILQNNFTLEFKFDIQTFMGWI